MIPVDAQTMFEVAPRFSGAKADSQVAIITAVGAVLRQTLEEYEINTRLRIAHFLGQICHESAGFRTTEEFASGAAYEGRKDLGNVKKGELTPTALSARKPEMRSRKTQEARACRHARANFLYLMRFGSTASSPRRRFLSSS